MNASIWEVEKFDVTKLLKLGQEGSDHFNVACAWWTVH